MKLNNLKKTLAVSALGLVILFGVSENTNAQTRKQVQKQQQKVYKQQQKLTDKSKSLKICVIGFTATAVITTPIHAARIYLDRL